MASIIDSSSQMRRDAFTLMDRSWIWNLHGELIDFALEKMSDYPDDTTCRFEHYTAACKLGAAFYSTIYPFDPSI